MCGLFHGFLCFFRVVVYRFAAKELLVELLEVLVALGRDKVRHLGGSPGVARGLGTMFDSIQKMQ